MQATPLSYSGISSALLYGALALIPLAYSFVSIDPGLHIRCIILALLVTLLAAAVLVRLRRQSAEVADWWRNGIVYAQGLFVLLMAIALPQALSISEAGFDLARTALLFSLLALAGMLQPADELAEDRVIKTLLCGIGILCIITVFQWADYRTDPSTVRSLNSISGTLGNKNLLSSYLAIAFGFVVYALLNFSAAWRLLAASTAGVSIAIIVLLQSRAVWLALLAGLFVCGLAAVLTGRKTPFQLPRVGLAALAALIVAGIIAGVTLTDSSRYGVETPTSRLLSVTNTQRGTSAEMRLTVWKKTLQMASEHPLGVGPGNWKFHLPAYGTEGMWSEQGERHYIRPHNDFLWVLAEGGIAAFLSYAAGFLLAYLYCWRRLLRADSAREGMLVLAMLCGLTVYLVDACFSFPKERFAHQSLLIIIFALAAAGHYKDRAAQTRSTSYVLQATLAASCLMIGLAAFLLGIERYGAEASAREALVLRNVEGAEDRLISTFEAGRSQWYTLDPSATPLAWYSGVAHFVQGEYQQALQYFREAHRAHPNHLHVLNNLATASQKTGDIDGAITYYERALVISPNFAEAATNLCAIYYNLGDYHKAMQVLLSCKPEEAHERYNQYLIRVKQKLH